MPTPTSIREAGETGSIARSWGSCIRIRLFVMMCRKIVERLDSVAGIGVVAGAIFSRAVEVFEGIESRIVMFMRGAIVVRC